MRESKREVGSEIGRLRECETVSHESRESSKIRVSEIKNFKEGKTEEIQYIILIYQIN